jgi:hypothetical protein
MQEEDADAADDDLGQHHDENSRRLGSVTPEESFTSPRPICISPL